MQILGKRLDTNQSVAITLADDRIAEICSLPQDDHLPWIAPGLFDVQINGGKGIWFSSEQLTVSQVLEVLHELPAHGITRLFPTVITGSHEAMRHGLQTIRQACEQESWANDLVAGVHLEGPYLSPENGPRGAHPLEQIRACDWSEFEVFQQASGGRIRLATLAPEQAGALEFIRRAQQSNVVIALGHTAAKTDEITHAVDAGARLSTHLGNAAHPVLPRHPNYIWDQLGEKRLGASIIADGAHLPASVVRSIYYAKGPARTLLISDVSGLGGMPPGTYPYGQQEFEVLSDGRIVVAGQSVLLAGSALLTESCVVRMAQMVGCPLNDAWRLASETPARMMGMQPGALNAGAFADLTLFHYDAVAARIDVTTTYVRGRRFFVK